MIMRAHPNLLRRKGLLGALGLCAGLVASRRARSQEAIPGEPAVMANEAGREPTQFARHTLTTSDGVRLNVLECRPAADRKTGSRNDPTIVLLPGWCMPASIWRAQLLDFGARWRTLAIDPRGQGESDIPASGYTAERRADDLHDVLAGHEEVVLVAWSLGVLEALHLGQPKEAFGD